MSPPRHQLACPAALKPGRKGRALQAPDQGGAVTLLVAIGLVVLASLTSLYSARSVWIVSISATGLS